MPSNPTTEGSPEVTSKRHAMTCDVEDYFHVSAFDGYFDKREWASLECRLPRNVDRILELFSDHNTSATFFVLGWVALQYPQLVKSIASAGHEIASHGMEHMQVWQQKPAEFRDDVIRSKDILEDLAGVKIAGYRAASWSIDGRSPWAHDVLAEAGYEYSSSVYPIRHDHYGAPEAGTAPYCIGPDGFLEIPASTVRLWGRNIAAAGGGYFRLYPFLVSRWLMAQVERSKRPYIFYFHPWEIDPSQPRVAAAPVKAKFRHYLNLGKFEGRLKKLLTSYRWGRMDDIFLGST